MMELMAVQPRMAAVLDLAVVDGDVRVAATLRALGNHLSLDLMAVDASGGSVNVVDRLGDGFASVTSPLMDLADEHRAASYVPGAGSWFVGVFTLSVGGGLEVETDFDSAPLTGSYPVARRADCVRELEMFPRSEANIPDWLSEGVVSGA